jgi:hypothetical protein
MKVLYYMTTIIIIFFKKKENRLDSYDNEPTLSTGVRLGWNILFFNQSYGNKFAGLS